MSARPRAHAPRWYTLLLAQRLAPAPSRAGTSPEVESRLLGKKDRKTTTPQYFYEPVHVI